MNAIGMLMILGAGLGALGQAIRAGIGVTKSYRADGDILAIDFPRMVIGLLTGAVAGVLAMLVMGDGQVTRALVLAVIAAGYSGTDAIEGLLNAARRFPVWILAVGLALLLLVPTGAGAAAGAPDPCRVAGNLRAELHADGYKVALYAYHDDQARTLAVLIAARAGRPAWKATDVVAVYTPEAQITVFYVYAGAGRCLVDGYTAPSVQAVEELFDAAEVPSPIGPTFYALPPI